MQRLLRLAALCVISGTLAFAQGTVTDQQPSNSGSQPNGNSVNTSPNGNRSLPGSVQGKASRTPSAPNQSLPGDTNPANASASDGKANGRAVRGGQPDNGGTGTAAGNNPNGGDNSNNNGMSPDGTGNNPAAGRDTQTNGNPRTGGRVQWFWVALALVLALFVIRLLMSRNRVDENIDRNDPALRVMKGRETTNRSDSERERDRIRRAG